MTLRVLHWGTGNTGRHALRGIIEHPQLELVGLVAHTPSKVGVDAGILCGTDPVGVLATADVAKAAGLAADCLCYCGDNTGRDTEVCADVSRFLERGTNVVTTSMVPFTYPPAAPVELRDVVEAACAKGQTSLFNTGIDPGYGTSGYALSTLSVAHEIRSIRVQQLADISRYGVEPVMRQFYGFGMPLDYQAPLHADGDGLIRWFGGTVRQIADAIGARLDDMRVVHEVAAFDEDIQTAFGTVQRGTIAVVRFEVQGISGGHPLVVLEHVDRAHPDAGPQWARPLGTRDGAYVTIVEGRPSFRSEIDFDYVDGFETAVIATAMHAVNAIPAVCLARPGLLGPMDLPAYTGRYVVSTSSVGRS